MGLGACSRPPAGPPPERVGLPNLQDLGDGLWSGATPEGDGGFGSLRELGVKTVISVDGTRPDVERARQFGLRYVHIPVEYGGITREQALRLVRAAAELPGPIYVHCHHGQHRGPAAAAIMRRSRGWTADDAVAFLHTAGTDPRYEGLYACVRDFAPPSPEELSTAPADFPEVAAILGLTARMVEIDELWDAIKRGRANGWQPPGPGESAAHLALRLDEQFREAARLPGAAGRPESFRRLLADAERAAADLETALRAGDAAAAGPAADRSAAACAACHREYRDAGPRGNPRPWP